MPSINFGSLPGPGTSPGAIPVTVVCPAGMTFYVGSDGGQNSLGSGSWRLAGPSQNYIAYGLYQDTARTVYAGGTAGLDEGSATGTGSSQIFYLYPKTFAHTSVPGTYTDSVQVRVTVAGNQTTTQMSITATVPASCTISTSALTFGNYSGAQIDTTVTISITCTDSVSYAVYTDGGVNGMCCWTRNMLGPGGSYITYEIYMDSARTIHWGNTPNLDGVTGTGTGLVQRLTGYGRLFGGEYVTPGAYSDTIGVTVTY